VLDTHSPLCVYPSLRCTDFDIVQPLADFRHQTFRTNPPTVQVGQYGRPTVTPTSQAVLLQALAAQISEELQPDGALLPQNSADGLRATIWRAHEGQIRAWTEKEVLSVYSRLSDISLSDIMDKLEAQAPIEEITDIIKEEIAVETRGKYRGLIAQEKTKAYEAALEEARADALKEALELGKKEAAQKGKSYEKMQLGRAEEEACLEAARIFKKRMSSARDKLTHQVETEIRKERDQILAERRSALEVGLSGMDWDARVNHICSLAVQVGLLSESQKVMAEPPKRAEPPRAMTAPKAAPVAVKTPSAAESEAIIARFIESSAPGLPTGPPHIEPSPCPAAGEDDLTPRAEASRMDWAEDSSEDLPPLPIDFDSKERSSSSSIHCAANAMVDDSDDVIAISTFRDPDLGALPLSPSPAPPPILEAPPSEVTQLFNLIMDTIKPMQAELKRIGDKVDGRSAPPPKPCLASAHPAPAVARTNITPPPRTHPSPPTPSPPQRIDDDVQVSDSTASADTDFPPLAPSGNRKTQFRHKSAAAVESRNTLVPGAPAPVQKNPASSYVRAPPHLRIYPYEVWAGFP
jgi:hypothetical protein